VFRDQTERAVEMIQALTDEAYECMVCYDFVRRRDPVWACEHCFAVFHSKCVVQWSAVVVDRTSSVSCRVVLSGSEIRSG
jgi:transcriptional repressor NF-X1